jgi:DNA-binding HxlR family transcriptional regulator
VAESEIQDESWYSVEKDTMKASDKTQPATCPAQRTLDVIGGRWKVPIVYHLFEKTRRFSELRRALPGCTQKMLTQQLRELERDGVVKRKVYAQVPPKVEYSLTEMGRSLKPIINAMCRWGGRDACGPKR